MSSLDQDKLAEYFEKARFLKPAEREQFLVEVQKENASLHEELVLLLAHVDKGDAFFESLEKVVPIDSSNEQEKDAEDRHASVADLSGSSFTHFQLGEQLGRGGMGVVYKAFDTRLNRSIALKFLPPHLNHDEASRNRFVQEARAASALDHPNICTIYEIGETSDGRTFIAMAYYPGETLKQKIARERLPTPQVVAYALQMARGLARAHLKDIVHRDIKPANVIVTDTEAGESGHGNLKILDFGLAKIADIQITQTGSTMGTVAYMSPEQTKGSKVDHRTDIWSLGVVFYEMLAGERPFKGHYADAVIYAILNEDPPPPGALNSDVPDALSQIVMRCLNKDVTQRYGTLTDLIADLENVHQPQIVEASSPSARCSLLD